jgi:uncharacterized membrane protein
MLWAVTVYFVQQKKPYVITLIPAVFMTVVCTTFLLSEQLFNLGQYQSWIIAAATCVISLVWFFFWFRKTRNDK